MTTRLQPQLDPIGPLNTLMSERAELRVICDRLELIADQLSGPIDRRLWLSTLARLAFELPLYQADEEALYNILGARTQPGELVSECIDQALRDHRHYQDYTLEIADSIEDHLANAKTANPDALGYLLRCAFAGIRQHMAWEDVTLLGPLMGPLTNEETEQLRALFARNLRSRAPHLRVTG